MFLRSLVRSTLAVAMIVTAIPAFANSELDRELDRLSNIINNNIPSQYRDQLNESVYRLRSAASNQGQGQGRPRQRDPICSVVTEFGSYIVKRGTTSMSQYRSSIVAAAQDHRDLANAGICGFDELWAPCSVEAEFGSFIVKRDGVNVTPYRSSALSAAADMRELADNGLCF